MWGYGSEMKTARIIVSACRIVVAVVFIAASLPKILQPHDFALAVFRYQMAPYWFVNIVAIFLPWVELIAGLVLLFVPSLRDAAALLLLGLLVFFTTAITINIFRGIDIACGCFSVDPDASRIGWRKVGENLLLVAAAAVAFRESRRQHATLNSRHSTFDSQRRPSALER